MKKEDIFTIRDVNYYAMDGRHSTFVAMRISLNETIDIDMLQIAADKCRIRMPYLFVKLEIVGNEILSKPNNNKFVVHCDELNYLIDARDNDDFLCRLSINNNIITFYIFHGLTDASGMISYLKLLLGEYFKLKGEEVIDAPDSLDIDEMPKDIETLEPMELLPDDLKIPEDKKSNFIKIKGNKIDGFVSYTFEIEQDSVMKFASSNDGSPNAIMSIALANAINKVNTLKDNETIDISVAINAKNILGCKEAIPPCTQVSTFNFDNHKLKMDIELLNTCVRGKIIKDALPEILYPQISRLKILRKMFNHMKRLNSRKLICNKSTSTQTGSGVVSYVGRLDFGSIKNHIQSIYTFCDSATPILEINCINNKFYFAYTANFEHEEYANNLCEVLNNMGLKCNNIKRVEFKNTNPKPKMPKFGFNLDTLELIKASKYIK